MGAILPTSLVDFAQGVCRGTTLTQAKRLEDSVRTGRNQYLTAAFQCGEVNCTTLLAESAVTTSLGAAPLPLPLRAIVYVSPALLALAIKMEFAPRDVQKILIFIQDHLGTVCQIISVVSSVALICFGSFILGGTSLAILGIGFLDREGLLPERVRHIIHDYSLPVIAFSGIIDGSLSGIVGTALYIGLKCISFYFDWRHKVALDAIPAREIKGGALSYQDLQDLVNGTAQVEINRDYIHYSALPPAPNVDIDLLNQLFGTIDWQKNGGQHMHALREKLKRDPIFKDRMGDLSLVPRTDQELIDYAKNNLANFIANTKAHHMKNGEIRNYDMLEIYLKINADNLQKETHEVTKVDGLMRLAVEAGAYCGPGRFEATEDLFSSSVNDMPGVTFRTKVLHTLQTARNRWFDGLYQKMIRSPQGAAVNHLIDWFDVHIRNQTIKIYADSIGLRKAGADNDATAVIDPMAKAYFLWYFDDPIATGFWNDHDLGEVLTSLNQAIQENALPRAEYYAWWQQWIQNAQVSGETRTALFDTAIDTTPSLLGRNFEHQNGNLDSFLVRAMLVDMGVLKLVRPATQSAPTGRRAELIPLRA